MWARLLRIFSTGLNAWHFSANPVSFVLSVLLIIAAPYFIYVFWGSLIFFAALAIGGWALYHFFKKRRRRI